MTPPTAEERRSFRSVEMRCKSCGRVLSRYSCFEEYHGGGGEWEQVHDEHVTKGTIATREADRVLALECDCGARRLVPFTTLHEASATGRAGVLEV